MPSGDSAEAQRDELRAQLVEVAGERRLLRDLAERRDRDDVTHIAAVGEWTARWSSTASHVRSVVVAAEGEEVEAPATGTTSTGRTAVSIGVLGERPHRSAAILLELGDQVHACQDRAMESARKTQALELFSPLGSTYDRIGAVLSFGQDPLWRRFLVGRIPSDGGRVLDVATGTGLVAERLLACGHPVVGLDQSADMLASRAIVSPAGLELVEASAEALPFADGSFDHLTFTYLCATWTTPERRSPSWRASCARWDDRDAGVRRAPRRLAPALERVLRGGAPSAGRLVSPALARRRERSSGLRSASFTTVSAGGARPSSGARPGSTRSRSSRRSLGGAVVMWGRRAG